jgi:hypothetical protein
MLTDKQTLNVFALGTVSQAHDTGSTSGFGGQARYSYRSRTWNLNGHLEHYDPTFRMDTVFSIA